MNYNNRGKIAPHYDGDLSFESFEEMIAFLQIKNEGYVDGRSPAEEIEYFLTPLVVNPPTFHTAYDGILSGNLQYAQVPVTIPTHTQENLLAVAFNVNMHYAVEVLVTHWNNHGTAKGTEKFLRILRSKECSHEMQEVLDNMLLLLA